MSEVDSSSRPAFPKGYLVAALALAIVGAGAITLWTRASSGRIPSDDASWSGAGDPLAPDPNLAGLAIPEFTLTAHDGSTATRAAFEDRLTVLAFGFTNCPFACPLIMARMAEVQRATEGTPLRFVFVSVDGGHDTPDALRAYGDAHGVDWSRWTMLTGDPAETRRLVTEGLRLSLDTDAARTIDLPDGSTMANINHPTHLILVGPDAHVLGLFGPSIPGEAQRLAARAHAASVQLTRAAE